MKLLCKLFGHDTKIVKGDCFIASSHSYCTVKADWIACKRGDYNQMLSHKHKMKVIQK